MSSNLTLAPTSIEDQGEVGVTGGVRTHVKGHQLLLLTGAAEAWHGWYFLGPHIFIACYILSDKLDKDHKKL